MIVDEVLNALDSMITKTRVTTTVGQDSQLRIHTVDITYPIGVCVIGSKSVSTDSLATNTFRSIEPRFVQSW